MLNLRVVGEAGDHFVQLLFKFRKFAKFFQQTQANPIKLQLVGGFGKRQLDLFERLAIAALENVPIHHY